MKLKEYPGSWRRMWQLGRIPLSRVRQAPAEPLPLTVCITSIPSRLHVLPWVLRSLLTQNRPAARIILWLHHDLRDHLPGALESLVGDSLEIRYRDQHSSHRKLVFALQELPEELTVTCDDDLMYHPDALASLYETHLVYPQDVIGNACRRITYTQSGELMPYKQWPWETAGVSTPGTLPIGFGGTLYPPGALHAEATDSNLYMALAPRADDLWFKVMALQAGTAARRSLNPPPGPLPIPRSQRVALGKTNVRQDGNREQWQRLMTHYQFDWTHFST